MLALPFAAAKTDLWKPLDGSLNHLRATVRVASCIFMLQKNGKDYKMASFLLLAWHMLSIISIWGHQPFALGVLGLGLTQGCL